MLGTDVISEMKVKSGNSCHCCPYGFHIDRDFVRYCASLYSGAQVEKLRQKRERRKEHRTVESYLGLNICASENLNEYPLSTEDCKKTDNEFLCDLETAVMDFEDTWRKSLNKKTLQNAYESKSNIVNVESQLFYSSSELSAHPYDECSPKLFSSTQSSFKLMRSNSDFSVSSRWANSLKTNRKKEMLSHNASRVMLRNMEDTVAALSKEETCFYAVGVHKNVLTNIREQMATSLKRMKELEEQVKCIPLLQDKLSALKEDKRLLLQWLKTKHKDSCNKLDCGIAKLSIEGLSKKICNNTSVQLNDNGHSNYDIEPTSKKLSSPALASNLEAVITKKRFVDSEIISQLTLDEDKTFINGDIDKKLYKSVGTLCSILTRDVGVGHIQNKFKSVGIGDENIFSTLTCPHCAHDIKQLISVSSESLGSDSESADDCYQKKFNLKAHEQLAISNRTLATQTCSSYLDILSNKSNEQNSKPLATKSTLTENNIPSIKDYHEIGINTAIWVTCSSTMTDLTSSDLIPRIASKKLRVSDKSTWCDCPSKTSKGVQVITPKIKTYDASTSYDIKFSHSFSQTLHLSHEKGVQVQIAEVKKVPGSPSLNNYHTNRRSIGIGDLSIANIICDNCQNKHTVSVGCGNSSILDNLCDKCKVQKRTFGIGDFDVNQQVCTQCVSSLKLYDVKDKPLVMHSIGINTCEIVNSNSYTGSDIKICDNCSATIHTVAQNFASRSKEICDSSELSKIPKLNTLSALDKGISYQSKCVKTTKSVLVSKKTSNTADTSSKNFEKTKDQEVTESKTVDKSYQSELSAEDDKTKIFESVLDPFKIINRKRAELSKEVNAACKVFNDYLQKSDRKSEKGILTSLNIIQQEWFKVANQKNVDPHIIEDYLDAFEEFSKPFLHHIVNLADSNGNTAIHYAVSYSNFDVVSILIDSKVCDLNKQNKAGYTCIMLVALADVKNDAHQYVVQRLFNMGDINIKAIQNGQTALMLAVSHRKIAIVKMLVEAGVEINLQDNDGSTALMCAAEHGCIDIVKYFLSLPECDPAITDTDGSNALTIAMEADHKDIGLLIYKAMTFSRGSSPYSSLKQRRRSTPRSTPPSRTPTLRTSPPPSPSARSTSSLPSSFHFMN